MLNLIKAVVYYQIILFHHVAMFVDNYYCGSNYCQNETQHVMCKFQFEGPARHCINYERIIKSERDKQLILDKINARRNKIASGDLRSLRPAENMVKLNWNEELALFAQRWADQCVERSIPDKEDSCRDLENVPVGQNIATIYGEAPGLTPVTLVDLWYMELLNVNSTVVSQYERALVTGSDHYDYFTQLMWAETTQVGCGAVKFKEQKEESGNIKNTTVYRLVCNFAPAGNQVGKTVYADGLPCSRCPFGGSCDHEYKSLCALATAGIVKNEDDHISVKLRQFIRTKYSTVTEPTTAANDFENSTDLWSTPVTDYDENVTYNFFSDFLKNTTETTSIVQNTTLCKDVLPIEELLNLLKKMLSQDQTLRELLISNKSTQSETTEETFTDSSVAAIMSRIYSKKESTTTTKMTVNDYINSTLLVNLVEAVIFRNNERLTTFEEPEANTQSTMDVNPVKIQAELGEVRSNTHFTGHYFFPEDNNDEPTTDKIDDYYDTSEIPMSEVSLEIEDLRRNKGTKDFVEAILESDFITENSYSTIMENPTTVENKPKKQFDQKVIEKTKNIAQALTASNIRRKRNENDIKEYNNLHSKQKLLQGFISYSKLLKQIAADLQMLKLNSKFHCSQKNSVMLWNYNVISVGTLFFMIYNILL